MQRTKAGAASLEIDSPVSRTLEKSRIEAWTPSVAGVAEVFHAQITDYAYPAHCHDTWTVLIVDRGAIRYDLDSRKCGAVGDAIAILPPGVIHNGQAAPGAQWFKKRVLYMDESFIPIDLVGAAVDSTNIFDTELRTELVSIHDSLVFGEDPLDAEVRLTLVRDRLIQHLSPIGTATEIADSNVAHQLRRLLDEHLIGAVSLDEAAMTLDRSKSHLVRSFTGTFGVSPHAYVIGQRVEAARPMLLRGESLANVATKVGFYDQAHFTRHFKRHTSITPGRYASSHG